MKIIDVLWELQEGLCWICAEPMSSNVGNDESFRSIDHLIPLSRGGANTWKNKLLAHRGCNSVRGAPPVQKLAEYRQAAIDRLRNTAAYKARHIDKKTYTVNGAKFNTLKSELEAAAKKRGQFAALVNASSDMRAD